MRKVKATKTAPAQQPSGTAGTPRGMDSSLDELVPDDLDDLEELEQLDSDMADMEELFDDQVSGMEEPPISERDRERLAQQMLETSKREMELRKLERKVRGKKVRKVRDPRAELAATLSVIIATIVISMIIFFITFRDYSSDASSSHDEEVYKAIKDEKAWVFFNNSNEPDVVPENLTGSITGKDAADDYKDWYRMNGEYSRKVELGFLTLELNWVYYMVIGILVLTGPNGVVRRNNINKLKAKEAKFPDFIRDLAEFWKGGLSMKVAVDTLSKGDYGALDDEVDFMATQLSWGVAFDEVLRMFLERVHTGLIERSIALIEEANRAGGKISDILLNVAHDAQEIKMLDREREGTMKSYIFVTFISFLIYVIIIVVMAYVFLPAIAEHTADLEVEGGFGNVRIQTFDPTFIALLFFSSVLVQGIGGGVNAGIMGEGNTGASLWYITLFVLLGAIIFQFTGVKMGL